MNKIYILSAVLVSSLFFSCSNENDYSVKFNETEFNKQRMLWEEQRLRNYSYEYDYFASSGPLQMEVEVKSGIPSTNSEFEEPYTIDEVFQKIQNDYNYALTQNSSDKYGVSIRVIYDEEFHYPKAVEYSTSYKKSVAGGEWYKIKINNFEQKN